MVASLVPTPALAGSPTSSECGEAASELQLLSAMKFGSHFSTQGDGRMVYISPDSRLCCEHGEVASTITHWLALERNAKKNGTAPQPRGGSRGLSKCNCQSTEGLNVTPAKTIQPPRRPSSLFSFLQEKNTEMVRIKGLEARQVPHLSGPTFLLSTGHFVCRHGASRLSLIRKQRSTKPTFRLPKCGCELKPPPVRSSWLNGVPLHTPEEECTLPPLVSGNT